VRVLRIYHSAVVTEFQQREHVLRRRHGHEVEIVCPPAWPEGGTLVSTSPGEDSRLHVVQIHGRRQPNWFWYDSSQLREVIRAVRPEIIDLHEEPFSLAAGGVLRAISRDAPRAKLCVYTAQNLPKRYPPPFSLIERQTLKRAGAAYPCSTEAGQRMRDRGFEGQIHVLPLGVTIPPPREPRPSRPLNVGFVGRLEPYKGGLIAVRAFASVAAEIDVGMEIIGTGSDEERMRTEADRAGLRDRVRFHGVLTQDETLERMSSLDIVLVPSLATSSWKEQFGRVPAQAMAHGAAVIASDSGSLRDVVDNAGVLVQEGDQEGFNRELARLLEKPDRLEDLRRRGYERAATRFSWEAVAEGMDAMYRELLDS